MKFLLIIAFLFSFTKIGFACECPEMNTQRSHEIINQAEIIFEGSVMDLAVHEVPEKDFDYASPAPVPVNPVFAKLRLRVLDMYKGKSDSSRITAYVDVLTSCGQQVQIGDILTFVLIRKDEVLVQTDNCNMPLEEDITALKTVLNKE